MSKFPSKRVERLFRDIPPNDQVGNSSEGVGWAGLWVDEFGFGGEIIVEHPDGAIDHFKYEDEARLQEAWNNFEKTLDIRQPDVGDLVITEGKHGILLVQLYNHEYILMYADSIWDVVRNVRRAGGRDIWLSQDGKYYNLDVPD